MASNAAAFFADFELDPLERRFTAPRAPTAGTSTEAWREECEVRWLKQLPFDQRMKHLAGVRARRGEGAAARLASLSNEQAT